MVTADQIRGAKTIRSETVDVPEWGGAVEIRGMSIVERLKCFEFFEQATADGQAVPLGILMLVCSVRSVETGERLLSNEDAKMLAEDQDGGMVNRLCTISNRVNGISESSAENAQKK